MGNQQPSPEQGKAQRPRARLLLRQDEDTVYSPIKYRETEGTKDVKDYTVSGGGGYLSYYDDGGGYHYENSSCSIVYQPGGMNGYTTGFLSINGVTLDGNYGRRTITFGAGSDPVVTPTTETKTFLVQQPLPIPNGLALDADEIVGNYTFTQEEN